LIIEEWEASQEVLKDSPNKNGVFWFHEASQICGANLTAHFLDESGLGMLLLK
jgi:hypothetical protein